MFTRLPFSNLEVACEAYSLIANKIQRLIRIFLSEKIVLSSQLSRKLRPFLQETDFKGEGMYESLAEARERPSWSGIP